MKDRRRETGRTGEAIAAGYLEQQGWTVLARNVRTSEGEIDIVARDADTLVFVEVRSRASDSLGSPEESVTPAKARRMVRCAQAYLAASPYEAGEWRIDFISLRLARGRASRLEHYKHAVP